MYTLNMNTAGQRFRHWPSMRELLLGYSREDGFKISYGDRLTDIREEIWMPPMKGTLNIDLVFKDVEIKFRDSLVYPKFDSCWQKGSSIFIQAKSTMSPGECYISSHNGKVVTAQKLQLTNTMTEYEIPISIDYHDGETELLLTCAKGQAKCGLDVEIDVRQNITSFVEGTTTWDYVKHTINPVNWFNGIIQSLGGSKWSFWDIISGVFWIVVTVICLAAIGFLCLKIYYCFRSPGDKYRRARLATQIKQ